MVETLEWWVPCKIDIKRISAKRCVAALSPKFYRKQTLWTHSKGLQFPALSASPAAPPLGRFFGAMSTAAPLPRFYGGFAVDWITFLCDRQFRETSCDEAPFSETSVAELTGERVVSTCFDHGCILAWHGTISLGNLGAKHAFWVLNNSNSPPLRSVICEGPMSPLSSPKWFQLTVIMSSCFSPEALPRASLSISVYHFFASAFLHYFVILCICGFIVQAMLFTVYCKHYFGLAIWLCLPSRLEYLM